MIGAENITLRRVSVAIGVTSEGRATDPVIAVSIIRASVQPARGRDLQYLTEGLRQSVEHVVYTRTKLRTADQNTGLLADQLVIDGETFDVVHVESHRAGLVHTKAFIRRLKETS